MLNFSPHPFSNSTQQLFLKTQQHQPFPMNQQQQHSPFFTNQQDNPISMASTHLTFKGRGYSETQEYKEAVKYLVFLHEERLDLFLRGREVPRQWEANWERQVISATTKFTQCFELEASRAKDFIAFEKTNVLLKKEAFQEIQAEFFLSSALKERAVGKALKHCRLYRQSSQTQQHIEKLREAVKDLKEQLQRPFYSVQETLDRFILPNLAEFFKEKSGCNIGFLKKPEETLKTKPNIFQKERFFEYQKNKESSLFDEKKTLASFSSKRRMRGEKNENFIDPNLTLMVIRTQKIALKGLGTEQTRRREKLIGNEEVSRKN